MKKRLSLLLAVAVIMALALVSCSGGGGGGGTVCTEAPIAITQGPWCITITNSQNTCGLPPDPVPYSYPATFNQSGSTINSTAGTATFAGTVCGSRAAMTGTNSGVTANVSISFSDASHASGSTDWSEPTCSGTDTFTAVQKSTCP